MDDRTPYIVFTRERGRKLSYDETGKLVEKIEKETRKFFIPTGLANEHAIQAIRQNGWTFIDSYNFFGRESERTKEGQLGDYARLARYLEENHKTELDIGRVDERRKAEERAAAEKAAKAEELKEMARQMAREIVKEQQGEKAANNPAPAKSAASAAQAGAAK